MLVEGRLRIEATMEDTDYLVPWDEAGGIGSVAVCKTFKIPRDVYSLHPCISSKDLFRSRRFEAIPGLRRARLTAGPCAMRHRM